MSALVIAVSQKDDLIHLVSDTAASSGNGSGNLIGLRAKLLVLPHAGAVIGFRGPLPFGKRLFEQFAQARCMDEVEDNLQNRCKTRMPVRDVADWALERAKRLIDPARKKMRGPGAREAFVFGWSHRDRRMKAIAAHNQSVPAFAPICANVFLAPALPDSEMSGLELGPHVASWPFVLLEAMKRQRRISFTQRFGEVIGGPVVLTTIMKASISQRVIHIWDDRTGARPAQDETEQRKRAGEFSWLATPSRLAT